MSASKQQCAVRGLKIHTFDDLWVIASPTWLRTFTLVLKWSSTSMRPRLSVFTPTSSSPSPSVNGFRPACKNATQLVKVFLLHSQPHRRRCCRPQTAKTRQHNLTA